MACWDAVVETFSTTVIRSDRPSSITTFTRNISITQKIWKIKNKEILLLIIFVNLLILTFPKGTEIRPCGRLGDPITSAQYFLCRILFSLFKSCFVYRKRNQFTKIGADLNYENSYSQYWKHRQFSHEKPNAKQ